MIQEFGRLLKFPGFKREGGNWRKATPDLVHIINCQSSKWNTSEKRSFTFNLGVFSREVYKFVWAKDLMGKPKETDGILRYRIGFFMESSGDKWWDVDDTTNFEELTLEISQLFENKVFPFFERLLTHEDLLAEIEANGISMPGLALSQINLACLYKVVGNDLKGKDILEKVMLEPEWGKNARRSLELF